MVVNGALGKIGMARLASFPDTTTKAGLRTGDVYPQCRDYCLGQNPWSFATKTVLLTPQATLWITGQTYSMGQYAIVSGVVYKCLISHTSATFSTDLAAGDWISWDWATTTAYSAGDFVNQGGLVYACLIPNTSSVFATDLANGCWIRQTNLTISMPNFGDGVNLCYAYPSDWIKPFQWNFKNCIRRLETVAIFSDALGLAVKYIYQNDDPTTYTPEFIKALQVEIAAQVCYDLTQSAAKAKDLREEAADVLMQACASDSQGATPLEAQADEWLISRLTGQTMPPVLPGSVSFDSPGVW